MKANQCTRLFSESVLIFEWIIRLFLPFLAFVASKYNFVLTLDCIGFVPDSKCECVFVKQGIILKACFQSNIHIHTSVRHMVEKKIEK